MARVLVQLAHPRTDRSEVNAAIAAAARELEGIAFSDLYAEYPDFDIDVDREQRLLLENDTLVFQHPVYWYSCPALLKEWFDLVLEHGFAYGATGTALYGKTFSQIVTCGAPVEAYRSDGSYENDLRTFFAPYEQTAKLCGMRYIAPFAVFGAGHAIEEGRLDRHVADALSLLTALRDDTLDLDAASEIRVLPEGLDGFVSRDAARA